MPPRCVMAKYRVIDSEPEQVNWAVSVRQKGRGNPSPNGRGKVARDSMPGMRGRILHNYATVIVHELEAEGRNVGEKGQNTNGRRPQAGERAGRGAFCPPAFTAGGPDSISFIDDPHARYVTAIPRAQQRFAGSIERLFPKVSWRKRPAPCASPMLARPSWKLKGNRFWRFCKRKRGVMRLPFWKAFPAPERLSQRSANPWN